MDIWKLVQGKISYHVVRRQVLRIVENQQQVATLDIVDTLEEQAILEEMLERTKPKLNSLLRGRHYLIATPFRYPPLRHGSRFGARNEPSLFYGSLDHATLLAEAAYYRFLFWSGMQTPPKSKKLLTQHTVFAVNVHLKKGLLLHKEPFLKYKSFLTHKSKYKETQLLGRQMRENGVDGFEFFSARHTDGINVGLFTVRAITSKKPVMEENWLCEIRADQVVFVNNQTHKKSTFVLTDFELDNKLPTPMH